MAGAWLCACGRRGDLAGDCAVNIALSLEKRERDQREWEAAGRAAPAASSGVHGQNTRDTSLTSNDGLTALERKFRQLLAQGKERGEYERFEDRTAMSGRDALLISQCALGATLQALDGINSEGPADADWVRHPAVMQP